MDKAEDRRVAAVRICRSHGEYQVMAYDQMGARWPDADYFTADLQDAKQTAELMVSKWAEGPPAPDGADQGL